MSEVHVLHERAVAIARTVLAMPPPMEETPDSVARGDQLVARLSDGARLPTPLETALLMFHTVAAAALAVREKFPEVGYPTALKIVFDDQMRLLARAVVTQEEAS